jgi:nucleotide-binding universal stress UspA family protein
MTQYGLRVLVWVEPGTWEACVSAAADLVRPRVADSEVRLVYVPEADDLVDDAARGLWGRRSRVAPASTPSAEDLELLADAEALLAAQVGEPVAVTSDLGRGPVERVITAASEDADYLVLGRQGDLSRRGPHSLGKHGRFVVDHAQCRVLIVWPQAAPPASTIPPLPREDPRR